MYIQGAGMGHDNIRMALALLLRHACCDAAAQVADEIGAQVMAIRSGRGPLTLKGHM